MTSEEQIGKLLGQWTDDEKAFAAFPITSHNPATPAYANAFLAFAYQCLRITAEDVKEYKQEIRDAALQETWDWLDLAREAIASRPNGET